MNLIEENDALVRFLALRHARSGSSLYHDLCQTGYLALLELEASGHYDPSDLGARRYLKIHLHYKILEAAQKERNSATIPGYVLRSDRRAESIPPDEDIDDYDLEYAPPHVDILSTASVLGGMTDQAVDLLLDRLVYGKTWDEIGEAHNMSATNARRLYGLALKKVRAYG